MEKSVFANRVDFVFLAILLAVSVFSWVLYEMENSESGSGFRVQVFTEPPQILKFESIPIEPVRVKGLIGPAIAEFRADGSYRIASSSCPHGICINYGWVKSGSVVCVPNGIVVSGVKRQEEFDAYTR